MSQRRMNRKVGIAYTKRSTSTKVFFPSGPAELASDTKATLTHIEMEYSTGEVTARAAVRYSDDGDTNWGTPVDVGTETLTGDGVLSSTTWNNLPGTPKMYLQHGVHVYNTAGSNLEMAVLAMRVEKRNF